MECSKGPVSGVEDWNNIYTTFQEKLTFSCKYTIIKLLTIYYNIQYYITVYMILSLELNGSSKNDAVTLFFRLFSITSLKMVRFSNFFFETVRKKSSIDLAYKTIKWSDARPRKRHSR